ncbi:hypothetical protein QBC46DRAFT_422867 [Diplogelasinospora grovesii]|uniref:Uncharacterized protein n=1 Tax=Diplogelasinospora grovesii TaxID=303347 RepID=A0AAN6MXI4_9PEZI|nr:hypothetical protein QBC46DRAFT_422867 [Diplogelasinospora grovesii]
MSLHHFADDRERQLETWLGETSEAVCTLQDMYSHLLPQVLHDLEIEHGLRMLDSIAGRMRDALKKQVDRYGESEDRGRRIVHLAAWRAGRGYQAASDV